MHQNNFSVRPQTRNILEILTEAFISGDSTTDILATSGETAILIMIMGIDKGH